MNHENLSKSFSKISLLRFAAGLLVLASHVALAAPVDVDADYLFGDDDAQEKCPSLCQAKDLYWNGTWGKTGWTDSPVCKCDETPPAKSVAPAPAATPAALPVASGPLPQFYGPYSLLPYADLPGNDLRNARAGSWQECANQCSSTGGCGAFTFAGNQNRCYLKSRGNAPLNSRNAVSGVIEASYPDQGSQNVPLPGGQGSYCSINSTRKCPGCAVSCPPGREAVCNHAVEGVTSTCARNSSCTCK